MTDPALSISTPHGRYYAHPTRRASVPSITNILNQKSKPGLPRWASRKAAEYAADNLEKLNVLNRDETVSLVSQAPFGRSAEAAIGDTVHNWIDQYVKGQNPTADEITSAPITARRMWQSFLTFKEKYQPKFVGSEFTVWSDTHGYAGTGDLIFKLGEFTILADTKTGKRVYPEVALQVSAIKYADVILAPDGTESEVPKFDRLACLHIRPTYSRLFPIQHEEECFHAFLGLKAVFDFEVLHSDEVLMYAPKVEVQASAAA